MMIHHVRMTGLPHDKATDPLSHTDLQHLPDIAGTAPSKVSRSPIPPYLFH